jgi:hypothetical protein
MSNNFKADKMCFSNEASQKDKPTTTATNDDDDDDDNNNNNNNTVKLLFSCNQQRS